MAAEWVPFGLEDDEVAEYRVLIPGVPSWLREPMLGWVRDQLTAGGDWFHRSAVAPLQIMTRIDLGLVGDGSLVSASLVLRELRGLSEIKLLRFVDALVSQKAYSPESAPAVQLEAVLAAAQSKWKIGRREDDVGLVERVPAGVQESVESTIRNSGSAGQVLSRAWSHVHRFEPNDSAGYGDAVKAVEIAAVTVVQPDNAGATLGSVIAQMRQNGDWRLPLREHAYAPSADMLLFMLRTLWHGHRDRHGSVDYRDVTHEEARSAVALAATLVDWFASGAVARRDA